MSQRFVKLCRQGMALCCAGALFQAGGCMTGTNEILAGLATFVVNNLVSSLVFGAFNLTP